MMSLELLVSFVTAFTFWFLIIPYARLYFDPSLPKKYEVPRDAYEDLAGAFTLSSTICLIVGMLAYSFLVHTAHFTWPDWLSGIIVGTWLGIGLHPVYLLHLIRKKREEAIINYIIEVWLDKAIIEVRKFLKELNHSSSKS